MTPAPEQQRPPGRARGGCPAARDRRGTKHDQQQPAARAAPPPRCAPPTSGRVSVTPLKRFSTTCAWISTPGTNSPSGVVLKSSSPRPVTPTSTTLPLQQLRDRPCRSSSSSAETKRAGVVRAVAQPGGAVVLRIGATRRRTARPSRPSRRPSQQRAAARRSRHAASRGRARARLRPAPSPPAARMRTTWSGGPEFISPRPAAAASIGIDAADVAGDSRAARVDALGREHHRRRARRRRESAGRARSRRRCRAPRRRPRIASASRSSFEGSARRSRGSSAGSPASSRAMAPGEKRSGSGNTMSSADRRGLAPRRCARPARRCACAATATGRSSRSAFSSITTMTTGLREALEREETLVAVEHRVAQRLRAGRRTR